MKSLILVFTAALLHLDCSAKTPKADRLFERWEYFRAANLYQKEAAKHPGADVYFKLGECYRKMNLRKEEQAAYDIVESYGTYSHPDFYLNYGQVLKSNGRNVQAKIAFDKYTQLVPSDPRGKFFAGSLVLVDTDHKWDEPVTISNINELNSTNSEFCPVRYKNGIVFSSNRKTPGHNKIYGWTGANYLDLFFAEKGTGDLDYTNITSFGNNKIIKRFNDGPACFSEHFDTIYISRVNRELKGEKKASLKIERNKIFMSSMVEGKWTKAIPFYLNNDAYSVANPLITSDGSRIYFVSDMPGGYGETDIYYCNRQINGWGPPINMGPNINTFNREKYPTLDSKGNFYFSSDGYQGFGGLDICVSINNGGVLAKAIPLKYPINSPYDDFGIMFLVDGKTGYFASNRPEAGHGDDDLFYFSLLNDKIDSSLTTSVYTIGYRPKEHYIVAVTNPNDTTKQPVPNDITIHFDFDRYQIRPDAIVQLDTVIQYMNKYPASTLVITGRCDCRGTSEYNETLAVNRSEAALRYLTYKGINPSRMTSKGYGTNNQPNRCQVGVDYSDSEHQVNRRAYIHFQGSSNK